MVSVLTRLQKKVLSNWFRNIVRRAYRYIDESVKILVLIWFNLIPDPGSLVHSPYLYMWHYIAGTTLQILLPVNDQYFTAQPYTDSTYIYNYQACTFTFKYHIHMVGTDCVPGHAFTETCTWHHKYLYVYSVGGSTYFSKVSNAALVAVWYSAGLAIVRSRIRIPPAAIVYQCQLSVPLLQGRLMSTSKS